ncbi:GNAT family N-acetyltransferase [Halobacteriaceae archaeon SHR40]|uniref:GNAT family N-acetyltransferase n=1 Tax=Halovenus amylolytica TaxID=2500550 RepID=UPI000FE2DB73
MGEFTYRAAKVGDAGAILTVKQVAISAIDSDEYTARQLDAWRPDDELVEEFGRAIESNRFEILLVESGPATAGYGVLNTAENRIDAVFVHPEYHGEGIGSSLVRQFESRARITGLSELQLVSSLNAKEFYETLGYRDIDRKVREINGVDLKFAVMRKLFDSS